MLTGKLYKATAVAMLAVLCSAAATEAQASKNRPGSDRLGGVVIQNPTSNTIYFQMRLGYDDAWTDYEVAAGQNLQVWFELDRNGTVQAPNLRFDHIGGDGRVSYKTYELDFYEVEYTDDMTGFRYEFQYDSRGRRLDLYSID